MAFLNTCLSLLVIYPIVGAFCWIVGAFCYKFIFRPEVKEFRTISAEEQPSITIMIPAHNEEVMIAETIEYLATELDYVNYEILVVDDGSTDQTPAILQALQKKYTHLRVIRIEQNKGKAHAFNIALSFAKGDFILGNDADTIPEANALQKYMNYFMTKEGQNIAAVTANADVQNRTKIIEKSQTVEFSSIVGTIKRGQVATLGTMYAYSGANTMYRKQAIYDAGLFRQDRATEDISICWDQQFNGWKAVFAPDIMFYINVPSSMSMLYAQRKRWAKGGTEVWLTNFTKVFRHPWKNLSKVIKFVDQTLSILWSVFYVVSIILFLIALGHMLITHETDRIIYTMDLIFVFITFEMIAGFLQLFAALLLDSNGKKLKYLFFAPFYMLWYWQMNAFTIVATLIPAIKTILGFGVGGTWKSPERTKITK